MTELVFYVGIIDNSVILLKFIEIEYYNQRYCPKLPGIFLYFHLVTLCNSLYLQYAYKMQILVWNFTFFDIKKVCKSMEIVVSV